MTLPPTEVSPSKRSIGCTTSSARAARGPRSTKTASRTTIRAERRGSRSQSSYSFILLSLSLSLSLSHHHAHTAARSAARRSTSYRDTRRDTAAVVTTLRLRRAIGAHEATKLSGAPPLLHFPQQLACQRLPATNVGVAVALCLHSDG